MKRSKAARQSKRAATKKPKKRIRSNATRPPYRPMPTAASSPDELADWLEFWALRPKSRGASFDDLVRLLKRSDTTGKERRDDADSTEAQRLADQAFVILNRRANWLGPRYPFTFENAGTRLEPKKNAREFIYAFLLLLTMYYPTSGKVGTAVLFEELCTLATKQLVAGDNGPVKVVRFGSPRLAPAPSNFRDAVNWLIQQLREGVGPHSSAGTHTGDDGLDIVAWRPWSDERGNQFAVFAQCAAGEDYESKVGELKERWSSVHFQEGLLLNPVRCIFLPRWVAATHWRRFAGFDVLVIDRGRLAESVASLGALHSRLNTFTAQALRELAS